MATLTFVVGGAASGKSDMGERLARATGKPRTYIATLQPFDDEMRAKVADHVRARGADWNTVEAPLDPGAAIRAAGSGRVVLLDCLTLWLTNVMLGDHDVGAATAALLDDLATAHCDVIVVSNEVGMGIVPDNALSRRFRNAQGRLNRQVAERADTVITAIAGLPLLLKGDPAVLDTLR